MNLLFGGLVCHVYQLAQQDASYNHIVHTERTRLSGMAKWNPVLDVGLNLLLFRHLLRRKYCEYLISYKWKSQSAHVLQVIYHLALLELFFGQLSSQHTKNITFMLHVNQINNLRRHDSMKYMKGTHRFVLMVVESISGRLKDYELPRWHGIWVSSTGTIGRFTPNCHPEKLFKTNYEIICKFDQKKNRNH